MTLPNNSYFNSYTFDCSYLEHSYNNNNFNIFQIKQLARLTGQDVKHSCLSLMKQLVANEVAILFSWQGAKKKQNFSRLNLCKVILGK